VSDVTALESLADSLLAASVEALDTIPLEDGTLDGAPPERSFVSPHIPALDCCPQLTVHIPDVTEAPVTPGGLAAGRRATSMRMNWIGLQVTIVRCVPVVDGNGNLPTIIQLEDASRQIAADGWALWNHIYNLIRAGDLFSYCGEVHWLGLRPIGPEGGCAGWTLSFQVSLDGYTETISS
jgi:hypothetical protein